MIRSIVTSILLTAGCVSVRGAQPVGSLSPDSLHEVIVTAVAPVRSISQTEDGSATLSRGGLSDSPSFMGSNDPVVMLRSLPAIATSNDLQATMNIRGCASGANAYYADGLRITNPLHMLGFYSAFNPDFFERYDFRPGYIPVSAPNTSGALLEAHTAHDVCNRLSGAASVGLIESHLAVATPIIRDRLSVAAGGRMAYPSKIFPNLLKLGTSRLQYGFADANLSVVSRLTRRDMLRLSVFADRDNTDVSDRRQGVKEGFFRWSNIAAGATWTHDDGEVTAYWTRYRNRLRLDQGGQRLDLPSGLDQITVSYHTPLSNGWRIGGDLNWRRTLGQHNSALSANNGVGPADAFEANVAAGWHHDVGRRFAVDAGARISFYTTHGYTTIIPQPRVQTTYRLGARHFVTACYQRQVRFDRLIETSGGGLPSDFWTTASPHIHPDDVHSLEVGAGGRLPYIGGTFRIDLYARRLLHATDYSGSVMDMLSPSYDGVAHIADAGGWARGVSVFVTRQFGRLRGRLGYNLGRTTLHSEHFGHTSYPAAYDRTHDLSVTLTWQPFGWLQLSASYVYATGLPYTRARYGYMIGENLICEYYPHNSSRLPDYNRLDLAASWRHTGRNGLRQQVTLAVYNALGSRNVLFQYLNYSVSDGISHRSSVMDMVIPSITYSISLR